MDSKKILRPFSLYLKTQKIAENTARNYLIDIRHFLGWLASFYPELDSAESIIIAQKISPVVLNHYSVFLKNNYVSVATINRRLSALRKLSDFFVNQGWIPNNRGKKIANIPEKKETNDAWQVLDQFAKSLKVEGKSSSTIRNYLSDVRGFLSFCSLKDDYSSFHHFKQNEELSSKTKS